MRDRLKSPPTPGTVQMQNQKERAHRTCIPSIHLFDERLHGLGGTTFALDLHAQGSLKHSHRPTYEQRMVEYVRTLSAYRRELQFFRSTYTAAENLTRMVVSVQQQMLLNYFMQPRQNDADEEWGQLADNLKEGLDLYGEAVARAESNWIQLGVRQSARDLETWV